MRRLISIILFGFISITNAQTKVSFSNSLKIEHVYGDESYTVEEMFFEIRDGKVSGKITKPDTNKLLSSQVILNAKDIEILNSFLKLVDQYKENCNEKELSSYVQYYTIIKDNQTINIRKFCDWKSFTYLTIKQKIFGKYLKDLEQKRKKLENEDFILLNGNWNENIQLDKLDVESICILTKPSGKSISNEYIEFKNENKAIFHRSNKTVYYQYRIDILNGNKYLSLFGDGNKNGEEFIYGHKFLILSLNKNEIKLKRT